MDKNFFGVSDNKLTDILNDFIKIESHHIKNISRNENNEITQIEWDPTWIKFRKKCKGKRKIHHHYCIYCCRIALHLFGERKSINRWCLECDNYTEVPSWYYKKFF